MHFLLKVRAAYLIKNVNSAINSCKPNVTLRPELHTTFHLENLMVAQLVNDFHVIYGNPHYCVYKSPLLDSP
jgi:hypothetical protein